MATPISLKDALAQAHRLLQTGKAAESEQIYRSILSQLPDQPLALIGLATIGLMVGQLDAAEEMLSRAIARDPRRPEAHRTLGLLFESRGQFDAAVASYREAIRLRPDYFEACLNCAVSLRGAGRLNDAIESARRAVALSPNDPHALNNLGGFLRDANDFRGAEEAQLAAAKAAPGWYAPPFNLAMIYGDIGDRGRAIASLQQAGQLAPQWPVPASHRLLMLLDEPVAPATLREEHEAWHDRFAAPLAKAGPVLPAVHERSDAATLRIGFVSGDLRDHPVGFFVEPLLSNLPAHDVQSVCYHTTNIEDRVTQRLRGHVAEWRAVESFDDAKLAAQIRDDRIDVLVDLAGHTGSNRLTVFARRPAPLQISWLGYPGTSGIAEIDAYLTDAYCDPPGMTETHFTEKLVRLPNTFACFGPIENAPAVAPPPMARNGFVTFGCAARPSKITDAVIHLWSRVLASVPRSRLALAGKGFDIAQVRERLIDRFRRQDLDPACVELQPQLPFADYLKWYERIDVILDTFPFNGHTTSVQALWMGVPVLTLAGCEHRSRMGVSVLSNAGLAEWVAADEQAMPLIATEQTKDLARFSQLRAAMRDRLQSSPLMNGVTFAADWLAAVRQLNEKSLAASGDR